MDWERAAIEAAAAYLRELIETGAADERARAIYDGLVDVLDPARHASRIERALAADAALALVRAGLDRRSPVPRRRQRDRRLLASGSANHERRSGRERRSGHDRRAL